MNQTAFEALRNHVSVLAGKYGLGADVRRAQAAGVETTSDDPYIEVHVFDVKHRPTLEAVKTSRESTCESRGVAVFDDFIVHEALPKLKPRG